MEYALLIPCYQPDAQVVRFTESLKKNLCTDIYMVNDGSGSEYDPIFEQIRRLGVHVISYEGNHGKGYAIRTGIGAICDRRKNYSYIITADSDGQHTAADIRKIADAACEHSGDAPDAPLILGVRDLSGKDVPVKSRFGNRFSSIYFKFVTGVTLKDTQTGLRAIPSRLYPLALKTPGDRYDYEMNFLMSAAFSIRTVPISTVYERNNKGSHFHAVKDSLLIYKTPLKYAASSLISAGVDLTLFTILTGTLGTVFRGILLATVGARCVSGVVNFALNRAWSFSSIRASDGSALFQAVRYLILFFTQMFLSSVLVTVLSLLPLPVTLIKMIVDIGLSFFSYYAQHNWVFRTGKHDPQGAVQKGNASCTENM